MRTETILNKMKKEIIQARENEFEREKFLRHINNVKLLCELFLEEEEAVSKTPKQPSVSYTEQEMKAMVGDTKHPDVEEKLQTPIDHDGANGTSIFDF